MAKVSAGLLMHRFRDRELQVLLVHLGGPFWAKKDLGAWSVPKGEFAEDEDPLQAAKREFKEETSIDPVGEFVALSPVKQPSGKTIFAWAFEGDCDPSAIRSNTFQIEWPPGSGKRQEFPEIDRAEWFGFEAAMEKIAKGQAPLLKELLEKLDSGTSEPE
jgi:predicted NUDIX family NTP pyrophosphohydrolase